MLEHGAECNAVDKYGHAALHRAASTGKIKICELLVNEFKASVNIADAEGNTPLYVCFVCFFHLAFLVSL